MRAKEFEEALRSYREPVHGLLGDGLNPVHPSGNSLLYEAHAGFIYDDLSERKWVNGWHHLYRAERLLSVEEGLLARKPPPAGDFQTHDDYVGCSAYSPACALSIVIYGHEHNWVFDNRMPGIGWLAALWGGRIEAWHGRFPGLVQHYYLASGGKLGPLDSLIWAASIAWTIRKRGNESGWLLDYLKLRCAERAAPTGFVVGLMGKLFRYQLKKHYGDINRLYAVYFHITHPFAQFSSWR